MEKRQEYPTVKMPFFGACSQRDNACPAKTAWAAKLRTYRLSRNFFEFNALDENSWVLQGSDNPVSRKIARFLAIVTCFHSNL